MDGKTIGIIAQARNVTEARKAAKSLGYTQEKCAEIFKNIEKKRLERYGRKYMSPTNRVDCRAAWANGRWYVDGAFIRNFSGFSMKFLPKYWSDHSNQELIFPIVLAERILRNIPWKPVAYSEVAFSFSEENLPYPMIEWGYVYAGTYGGAYRKYPKRDYTLYITFPKDYLKKPFMFFERENIMMLVSKTRILGQFIIYSGVRIKRNANLDYSPCVWVENAIGVGAHGENVHDAIASLRRKIKAVARKANRKITMNTHVTRGMYREITGACAEGVKDFCERHGLENKRSIKVCDLIPILKGEYGEKSFLNSIATE